MGFPNRQSKAESGLMKPDCGRCGPFPVALQLGRPPLYSARISTAGP
jgi:hypothetical protein